MALARAIRLVVGIVVGIIVLAVILRVVGANPGNVIDNVFSVSGPKLNMALNWGLAALVYAVVGGFIASFAARGAAAAYSRRAGAGRRTRPVA